MHVLFSLAALLATRARVGARVVFTGSTFALLIFDVSDVSAITSDTCSKSSKSPRNPNSNVG